MTRSLEDFYSLEDEIPHNGGRYIPDQDEAASWDRPSPADMTDEEFQRYADEETRQMLDYQETIDSIIAGTRPF